MPFVTPQEVACDDAPDEYLGRAVETRRVDDDYLATLELIADIRDGRRPAIGDEKTIAFDGAVSHIDAEHLHHAASDDRQRAVVEARAQLPLCHDGTHPLIVVLAIELRERLSLRIAPIDRAEEMLRSQEREVEPERLSSRLWIQAVLVDAFTRRVLRERTPIVFIMGIEHEHTAVRFTHELPQEALEEVRLAAARRGGDKDVVR